LTVALALSNAADYVSYSMWRIMSGRGFVDSLINLQVTD
jgi:hypothetical protein